MLFLVDISIANAADSIALAETYLVEADASEGRNHASMARARARLAGDAYLAAAHHLSRPAAVGEGSWSTAAELLRKASVAYLRGLSRKKAAECTELAANWEK